MSFKPSLEVPQKRKKAFDSSFCMVCQKSVTSSSRKSGRPPKKDPSRFQVFINVCERFHGSGDIIYDYIYDIIKGKTSVELDEEKIVFHPSIMQAYLPTYPFKF